MGPCRSRRWHAEGRGNDRPHRWPAGDQRAQDRTLAAHRAALPGVIAMLRKHRASQNAERLRAANPWQDSGLVFTTDLGRPVNPRNLLRVIEVAARTAGVAGVGVHTLRHSAAVARLESGVHIKAVADLLGHSSIATTGDVYGHTSDDTARPAVDALAGRLGLANVGGQS
jgi:integrase